MTPICSFKGKKMYGIYVVLPLSNKKSQRSMATHQEDCFGVKEAAIFVEPFSCRKKSLEPFQVKLARSSNGFHDTPPTKGYTAVTNNSLLEWNILENFNQEEIYDNVLLEQSLIIMK
jgi:hypothetical protein